MYAHLGWILLGLFWGALLLARAPERRNRALFILALCIASYPLSLARVTWLSELARALAEVAAIQLAGLLIFHVLLRRLLLPQIASDLLIAAGYAAVIFGLLARLGVNLAGLIATSAVLTAVVGFALQDMLGNLAGGLALQLERSIRLGDWIKTDQWLGRVRTLRIRHTAIETPDGDTILIPNSFLTRTPVVLIAAKHRKLHTFHLDYRHSPTHVMQIVDEALAGSPMEGIAEEPKPRCVVVDYHPEHVTYGVLAWMLRPGLEYVDSATVRTRINFALARLGTPLSTISHSIELRRPSKPEMENRRDVVQHIPIFHSLSPDETSTVAGRLRKFSYAPGEIIIREGDEGDSLYFLAKGQVRVTIANGARLTEEVAVLGPGEFFGEMGLLTGEKRSATVQAASEAECYRLEKADFHQVMTQRPELAEEISGVLVRRRSELAEIHDVLDEERMRLKETEHRKDLMARIHRFFGV